MPDRNRLLEWPIRVYRVDRADAEDILQECLLRLFERFRQAHPSASEDEWEAYLARLPDGMLYRALGWQACNWRRLQPWEQQALTQWAARWLVHEDLERVVLEHLEWKWFLSQLPSSARRVACLLVEGHSWEEIARQLGVGVSSGKMHFYRGVQAVQARLGDVTIWR